MNTINLPAAAAASAAALLLLAWFALGPVRRAYLRYMLWKKTSRHSGGDGEVVQVNGVGIYVERHGDGPDVVMLHGAMGFLEWFYNQIPALARAHRVIGLDSRGQGRSSGGQGTLSYDVFAVDVAAVLDQLGVRNAAFVGWSDGGIVAMKLAMVRPDLVGRLVLIGANFNPEGLFDEMTELFKHRTVDSLDAPSRKFYRQLSPHPELLGEVLSKINRMLLTEPRYTKEDLALIRCPTLVLNGADENAVRPGHTRELVAAIPGARLVEVPGADHLVPMQKPGIVNREILAFLGEARAFAPPAGARPRMVP